MTSLSAEVGAASWKCPSDKDEDDVEDKWLRDEAVDITDVTTVESTQ